jgi:serine/threonine protein phosphatase 1
MSFVERSEYSGARVPDGLRVYAIGDTHGRVDLLRKLQAMIRADLAIIRAGKLPHQFVVVYLGDYVDRGINCRELVDHLIDDPLPGVTAFYLRGNHEQRTLDFLDDPEIGSEWVFWGGDATLRSYGADIEDPDFGRLGWPWLRDEFRRNMPTRHLSFLQATQDCHMIGDYFLVHAGVRPGVSLADQSRKDMQNIRGDFLDSEADFGKVVVHGHSIFEDVDIRPNRISVDTGAWRSGKLSCVVLEQDMRHVFQT